MHTTFPPDSLGGRGNVVSMDQGVLTCQLFIILPWQKMDFVHCPFSTGDPMPFPIVTSHMFGLGLDWFFFLQSYSRLLTLTWCNRWQRGIRFKLVQRLPAKDLHGLLQVVRGIVLCCWWLLWCDRVWLLHTWGSWDMVGISKVIMQKVQTWREERYWWLTLHKICVTGHSRI